MFETKKSGLRTIATFTIAVMLFAGAGQSAHAKESANQTTVKFLQSKFVAGKYIEGFTPGKADYGFTLEALLQRKALGEKSSALAKAVRFNLVNTSVVGVSPSVPGYLFDSEGKLNVGLAGKFAFVSQAMKAPNGKLRSKILQKIKASFGSNGDLKDASATTFDRSWVILGLAANGNPKQAQRLGLALQQTQLSDGGFNDGYTLDASATDGTGIALQALAATRNLGSTEVKSKTGTSIAKAVQYLRGTQVNGDHWEAWGDYNTNGTAYAAMGIIAAGSPSLGIATWLKNKLSSDGGLVTPWSGGSGDTYATAQSVVPMLNLSYLSLLS
ncbi:MAG: hypothetical protein ACKORF_06090 [Micrococcales bacterium]